MMNLFLSRKISAFATSAASRTKKPARLILLGLLLSALHPSLVAIAPGAASPFSTMVDESVAVPAEIAGHVMFVNVMVNGHGPFRVMVDTGCSFTLVSPEFADAVGAFALDDEDEFMTARNGLGDPTDVRRVMLGSIELGSVRFEGVLAAVSDSFEKLSVIEGRRIDGALGFSLFHDLYFGLDFPNRRLLLGNRWPENAPPIRASLPVTEHADVPFVHVQIQDTSVEVMIDTGANQALQLPADLASSLQWKVKPRTGSLVAVIGEIGRQGIGRLAGRLSLGNLQQVEPLAVISAGLPSLGLRSLERYCVIFHPAENRMWLCDADPAPLMPTAERSIGLNLYSDRGGMRIAGVIPDSPAAEANLAPGALVTQIEEQPATSWSHDKVDQWIASHTSVALVVADSVGERALTLRVWDLVP